ncbi:MAG: tRNA epoxyqueuosine(34) reductase QueG [Bacteroidia bacterium]|nr:tRNA epoxyqueuosine(34) reductase QueG [Bacteroidia bacterium]MCF8446282.1 tRNA epoxyqueuosine(34) reductase QueG [Bacteroidia bacterium]
MNLKEQYSQLIKAEAKRLGFSFCGISKAGFLENEAAALEKWLNEGRNGKMVYMENHFDKRLDPTLLVDGAKSVISFLYNYHNPEPIFGSNQYKISQYAFGEDYHLVVKDKLKELMLFINETIGEVNGRAFVDSAPILEKAWAQKSGLGWMGKNGNIIHKKAGSYFFLSELILDLDLEYDKPVTDHCGSCTACIDACPTEAIYEPQKVDGSKCISYFTIELKDAIPPEMKGTWENWIFGCDICMDVCPWNRFSKKHEEPRFEPKESWLAFEKKDWEEITEDVFQELFKKSPLKRAKYNGLKKNIDFLLNS